MEDPQRGIVRVDHGSGSTRALGSKYSHLVTNLKEDGKRLLQEETFMTEGSGIQLFTPQFVVLSL
jgi:hypothetical protein